ncbi:MAG TPA: TIM-barrel domain-containing protein, partial [Solirubrobacterales bacterium]|nr:TIM-barrel domain-containing protein [Solirubrobacterales bacterium]
MAYGAIRLRAAAAAALATAVSVALAPAAAHADVRIGEQRIAVHARGAAVVIERSPFRLSFADRAGRTRLAQVDNAAAGPRVIAGSDVEPLGLDNLDGPTLYAPFAFKVGARTGLQIPAAVWAGNQLAGLEAGTMYSAREVTDVRRAGGGVELVLTTSDPAGRRIVSRIAPAGRDAIRVSARVTPDDGVYAVADSFAASPGEAFRGFGGRHNALDQRGQDFYGWVEQQNVGAGPLQPVIDLVPGSGGELYQFPNGPTAAYYVQSQFISSRGYGFLLDRDELSGWRMASDRDDAWQVSVGGSELDYVVAPGAPRRAMGNLTELTGRHRTPPRWATGPMFDRLVRFSGHTPKGYLADVRSDLDELERRRIPVSAYRIEAWQWLERSTVRELIRELHSRGIRALLYFRSYVTEGRQGTDRSEYYGQALANEWVAERGNGEPYIYLGNFNSPTAQIDYTDPEAVLWWKGRITEALRLGADGFMQDFGEQVMADMHFDDGSTGATMHNRYPVLFHRVTRQAVERFERRHPRREIFFYTRAGYSGTPGSAAYEGGNFAGDVTTDWSRSSGLASVTTDMLNRGIGGAFGYSADIGGYFDFHTPPTTKELFIRWAQWAALTPVMRLHGSLFAGTHTPWSYDEETVAIYRRLSRLRLRAAPLILRLWRRAERTGVPVARPLWLEYPNDQVAAAQDQQWLLGRDVLVAPVVKEGATSRRVYFPRGCWREHGNGRRFRGRAYAEVAAPLGRLPWFRRCGTRPFA